MSLVKQDAAHKGFYWTFPLYRPLRSLEQFRTQGFLRKESMLYKGVLVRVLNLHRDQTSLARAGGDGIFLSETGFHA